MYASMVNGYENVNSWHNSCNQPTNQPTNRIAWYFLRAIKPNIQRTRDFFCLQDSRAGEVFLMELSLFSEKTVETPYATFPEESELCEA